MPLAFAGNNALAAGNYVLTGLTKRISAVVSDLSPLLGSVVTNTINQAQGRRRSPIQIVTNTFNALTSGGLCGALEHGR